MSEVLKKLMYSKIDVVGIYSCICCFSFVVGSLSPRLERGGAIMAH